MSYSNPLTMQLNFSRQSMKKMMNIGPEKGKTLDSFLGECLECTRTKSSNSKFTFVELGTYCGYSCLRFLHRILQELEVGQFQIFTVDVEIETIRIAQELVTMAGLQDCVTFLHLSLSGEAQQLSSMLLTSIQEWLSSETTSIPRIDFLFIDHDKKAYLPDFKQLQSNGLIQKGTRVAADNVLFHGIDDYRTYIGNLVEKGVVESRLVEGSLEYVNELTLLQERHLTEARDGIGKIEQRDSLSFRRCVSSCRLCRIDNLQRKSKPGLVKRFGRRPIFYRVNRANKTSSPNFNMRKMYFVVR